jgi:hypothetical protein
MGTIYFCFFVLLLWESVLPDATNSSSCPSCMDSRKIVESFVRKEPPFIPDTPTIDGLMPKNLTSSCAHLVWGTHHKMGTYLGAQITKLLCGANNHVVRHGHFSNSQYEKYNRNNNKLIIHSRRAKTTIAFFPSASKT